MYHRSKSSELMKKAIKQYFKLLASLIGMKSGRRFQRRFPLSIGTLHIIRLLLFVARTTLFSTLAGPIPISRRSNWQT
jgi:hypothetical protein